MTAPRLTTTARGLLRSDGSVVVPPGAARHLLAVLEQQMRDAGSRDGGGRLGAELSAVAEALAAAAVGDWPVARRQVLVSLSDYATRTGKSPQYCRRLARAGRIPARRVGKTWAVAVPDIEGETA